MPSKLLNCRDVVIDMKFDGVILFGFKVKFYMILHEQYMTLKQNLKTTSVSYALCPTLIGLQSRQ